MSAGARSAPAWQRVLLAPWQQRRNQGSMWFWYTLAIALCAGAAGLALLPKVPAAWAAITLLATFALGGWIWLVNGVMLQNEPHAARLVPGHVRTLRRVLAVVGAAITLVAGLIGAVAGHPLLVIGATVLALLALAWVMRVPALGFFLWVVPATSTRWSKSPLFGAIADAATTAYRAQPGLVAAAVAAGVLAAVVASLRTLLQDGGARHNLGYRRRVHQRTLLRTGRADELRWASAGRFGGRLRALSTALYRRVLARASERRSGSVLARGLVGLGPQFHWSGLLGAVLTHGLLMMGIVWLVWNVVLSGPHGPESRVSATWPITLGVLSFAVTAGLAARRAFHSTRREQALLMLLPGMPRGAALNRRLAWRLIAQFGAIWAFGLVFCAVLLPLHSRQFGWVATLAFVCLPMCALLWRDWSTLRAPTLLMAGGPVLVAMLIAGSFVALQGVRELPVWPFVLGGVAVTLALLAWRWRVVVTSPAAFPAGRRI